MTVTSVNSPSEDTSQTNDPQETTAITDTSETTAGGSEADTTVTTNQGNISDPVSETAETQSDPIEVTSGDIPDALFDNNNVPVAGHDSSTTELNTPVTIPVLANDNNLDDLPLIVSIMSPPENGWAIVEEDNTITYTPNNDYTGTDNMLYKVADINGDEAIASIAIDIRCSTCLSDVKLTLSWDPNPDEVTGYAIYFGPSGNNVTNLASILPVTSGLLNPVTPSIQYHLGNDLGLVQGEAVCFRLKSYNASGFSDFSEPACYEEAI